MNVVVFGATGNIGPLLLAELLRAGHHVSAFLRTPSKITLDHPALTLIQGDVRDAQAVTDGVIGQEAIISTVGGEDHQDTRVVAMMHIIAAMQQAHVHRVLAIGGLGILQAAGPIRVEQLPVFPATMKARTEEHRRVFEMLEKSDSQWTLVCPPDMTREPATGRYHTRVDHAFLTGPHSIPLGDVAHFLVQELVQGHYIGHRVAIASQ